MRTEQTRSLYTLLFWAVVTGIACHPVISSAQDPAQPYLSVWAQLNPEVFEAMTQPGSLMGEFQAAARTRDEQSAMRNWQQFVDEFDPEDGYYEDGMHVRLVEWAKMELVRLQHRASGDSEAEQLQITRMREKTW